MSDEARQRNLNAESARSSIAQGLLNTNLSDRDQSRLTNSLFGGLDANRNDVALDIARAMTSGGGMGRRARAGINTVFRGGVGALSMGLLDPGNIVQQQAFNPRDVQNAYVNRMVSSGMSREQAQANARQNMPAMLQAVSRDVRYFSTDEQRRELERAGALAGHGAEGMNSMAQIAQGTLEGSYRRVYGTSLDPNNSSSGRAQRQAMGSLLDSFEGVGGNASQRIQSRGIMAAAASLRAVMNGQTGANQEQREGAQTKLRGLFDQMRRRGFSSEQINQIMRQTQNTQLTDEQRQMAGRIGNMSVNEIMTNMTAAAQERVVGEGQRLTAQGAERFGMAGGEMGRIFQVQDGSNRRQATAAEIMTGLQNAGGDANRLRALTSQNRAMGELARRASRGEDVSGDIERMMRGAGESADRAGREYDERESNRSAPMRALRNVGQALGIVQSRESAINEAISQGTEADQQALGQTTASSMLEGAARRLGIGGGNDQLLQAATELRRSAELLSGAAESGQLQRLTAADAAGV